MRMPYNEAAEIQTVHGGGELSEFRPRARIRGAVVVRGVAMSDDRVETWNG